MPSTLHLEALDQRHRGTTTRLKKVDDGGVHSRFYVHTDSTWKITYWPALANVEAYTVKASQTEVLNKAAIAHIHLQHLILTMSGRRHR